MVKTRDLENENQRYKVKFTIEGTKTLCDYFTTELKLQDEVENESESEDEVGSELEIEIENVTSAFTKLKT